ncbi:MAG: hypothetical protein KDA21_13120, partial [Phycisphaerales bacterium]|nr:hypothetical protein [Phycisphaerales bacterium]
MNRATLAAITAATIGTSSVNAATYTIDWLDMSPTAMGSSVPNGSVFNLPGAGAVTVTYSLAPGFSDARTQNPLFQNGSVTSGPDTWNWTSHELFGATNLTSSNPLVPLPWRITYSFTGTIPANRLYVGVAGLGQTTSFGGGATTATVNQNGTFVGDLISGGNYGATQFTSGPGFFSMQNSVNGAGGADPWWNTELGVVRINDAVSSITVDFSQISGDGACVNIGYAVPATGSIPLLAAA